MSKHILAHLSKADAVLGGLIRAVGPCALDPQDDCHPFQALAQAIAHQQLNGTAANTILKRLVHSCGRGVFPTPQMVLDASADSLRAAGFSFAKVAALKDLAAKTLAAVVPEGAVLMELPDEEIIERLTQVRGIGRWTVEMLLMFRLGRPDVLPVDDFGVRAGFRAAYGLSRMPKPQRLAAWGERWKPYRSLGAWYLWRANDLARRQLLPRGARPPRIAQQAAPRKTAKKASRKKQSGDRVRHRLRARTRPRRARR